MTQRWDADQTRPTRRFPGEPAPARPRLPPSGRKRKLAWAALAALCLAAVAVSATQALQEEARIGVCHRTGAEGTPYVFLVVKDDGYEHGHHRHHEGDFFVTDLSQGCEGDDVVLPPAAPGNGTAEPAEPGNTTEEPAEPGNTTEEPAEPGNATEEPAEPGNTTEEPAEPGNTTEEPAEPGNATEEPAEPGNGTEEPAPPGNATQEPAEPGNTTEEPTEPDNATLPGDAAVRQLAVQDESAVALTLRVSNVGSGVAHDVVLEDQLPDVRRTWQLTGADAAACVLDGRLLTCWFGDVPAGEERVVELRSFTDRMPCGHALTNTAYVTAADDAETRNDASSASIAARGC